MIDQTVTEVLIAQHFQLSNKIDHFSLYRIDSEIERINRQAQYHGDIADMTPDEINALGMWYSMRLECIQILAAARLVMKAEILARNEAARVRYGS